MAMFVGNMRCYHVISGLGAVLSCLELFENHSASIRLIGMAVQFGF